MLLPDSGCEIIQRALQSASGVSVGIPEYFGCVFAERGHNIPSGIEHFPEGASEIVITIQHLSRASQSSNTESGQLH